MRRRHYIGRPRAHEGRARTVAGGEGVRAGLLVSTGLVVFLAIFALLALPLGPGGSAAGVAIAKGEAQATADRSPVWVTQVRGIVDPTMAGFLVDTMEQAAAAQASAFVIKIDTPGGLDASMRDIIQAQLSAPIPIVLYVYPQGGRAASAGLYILMASDVAAMAPQTNVGAATPVAIGGDMDETMAAKVTNDAAAYIRGLAAAHGRNAEWAEQAVREAVSIPAEEALQKNVIEFVAPDLETLLVDMDGYVTTPKGLTLRTAGAPVHEVGMGWIQRFLHAIASPDIAYILMTIGILGIIAELSTPGLGGAGIGGVIALLLAFYSFQVLPVSLVGIALIVLALGLFIAELKIQSHGVLGVGGAAALVAGGLLLFDTSAPYLRVSWPVLITVAVLAFAFFMLVVRAVALARRRPVTTGAAGLVGATGVVVTPLSPLGQVRLHGEIWKARSEEGGLSKDERIEVLGSEGLTLTVRRAGESSTDSSDEANPGS